MDIRPLPTAGSEVSRGRLVTGARVRVSDASPHGFSGRDCGSSPGALTVARDDNGAWELVLLSRRRAMAVDQGARRCSGSSLKNHRDQHETRQSKLLNHDRHGAAVSVPNAAQRFAAIYPADDDAIGRTSIMTEPGRRVKTAGCVLGAGVLVTMAAVAAAEPAGQGLLATPAPPSGEHTSTQSTAPSTLATSIASPTRTAMPYGGEGCIGKDCFPVG
jgi:hypothetical protein